MSVLASLAPGPGQPFPAGTPPRLWTVEEFDQLGEDGWFEGRRAFLLDGVILEQGPMNAPHADGISLTNEALRAAFGPGWTVRIQLPLHIRGFTNPMPDLAVVPGGVRNNLGRHPTTAALVVEVSDTTLDTDVAAKAERYATAGVADYWVLDVIGRQLLVFRNPTPIPDGGAAYRDKTTLGPADTVAPLAAPNSLIAVSDLLP